MKSSGFSLVETLVAGALLGLIIVFALGPLQMSDAASARVLVRQRQVSLAHQLLEQAAVSTKEVPYQRDGAETYGLSFEEATRDVSLTWTQTVTQVSAYRATVEVTVVAPGETEAIVLKTDLFLKGIIP